MAANGNEDSILICSGDGSILANEVSLSFISAFALGMGGRRHRDLRFLSPSLAQIAL